MQSDRRGGGLGNEHDDIVVVGVIEEPSEPALVRGVRKGHRSENDDQAEDDEGYQTSDLHRKELYSFGYSGVEDVNLAPGRVKPERRSDLQAPRHCKATVS